MPSNFASCPALNGYYQHVILMDPGDGMSYPTSLRIVQIWHRQYDTHEEGSTT